MKHILAECEVNHDQILVVYATQHCDVINLDMSFSNLLRDAGRKLNVSQSESTPSKANLSHRSKVAQGSPVTTTAVSKMLQNMTDSSMCVLESYLVAEGYAVRSADLKILKIIPVRKGNEDKNNMMSPTKSNKDAETKIANAQKEITKFEVEINHLTLTEYVATHINHHIH